jgi:hypothetical protein
MVAVFRVSASAKLDGKVKIVKLETNKFISACPDAQITVIMISKLALAFATVIGPDMIARKLYAA